MSNEVSATLRLLVQEEVTSKMKQAGAEMEKLQKKSGQTQGTLQGMFRELAGPAATIGAGAALGMLVIQSFNAASALEGLNRRAHAIFEDGFPRAEQAAAQLGQQLGRSTDDLLGMESGFAAVLKGADITGRQMENLSAELTKTSIDISNFYGELSDEEAFQLVQGGVLGMGRALQRYGIQVNDATLQEFAHRKGIKDKVADMTQAQQMFLRANMIQEQTNKLVGDGAKGMKTAQSGWKEFKGNIGDVFQELGKPVLKIANIALRELNNDIKNGAIPVFSALGEGIRLVTTDLMNYATWMAKAMGFSQAGIIDYKLPGYKDTSGVNAGNLREIVKQRNAEAKKGEEDFKGYYGSLSDPSGGAKEGASKLDELKKSMEDLGGTYEDVSRSVTEKLVNLAQSHRDKMRDIDDSILSTQDRIKDLAKDYQQSLKDIAASEMDLLGGSGDKIAGLQKQLDEKLRKRASLQQQSNASVSMDLMDEIADLESRLAKETASRDLIMGSLTPDQIAEATRRQNLGDTGRSFEDLQRKSGRLEDDHATKVQQLQDEMEKLNQKKVAEEAAYTSERTQLQLTRAELNTFANDLATQMARMDKVTADTVKSMKGNLEELQSTISSIDSLLGSSKDDTASQKSTKQRLTDIPAFGDGGVVYGPTLALIGEKGAERITPLSQERKSSTSSITINVNIGTVTKEADMDVILHSLARKVQLVPLQSS